MAAFMPPVPPRFKSIQTRSSSYCTHRNLTRLYDPRRYQRCMICQRIPDLGFLYRCTQDTNGDLPASEFIDEDMAIDIADLKVHSESDDHPATNVVSNSTTLARADFHAPNTQIHREASHDDDVAIDEDLARAFDGKRKFEIAFPPEPSPQAEECDLKICQACRPIYRDRAWQSLNRVVDRPVRLPPQHELENRRISNAAIVSGLSVPSDTYAHPVLNSTSTSRMSVRTTSAGHAPQMRQVSHRIPSIFANRSPTVVTARDPPTEDGASDADDEKGFAKDDETETDTSDADSACNYERPTMRSGLSDTGNYTYGRASVSRPRSGTVIRHNYSAEALRGPVRGTNESVGKQFDTNQRLGPGGKPERMLSHGRFYID